MSLEHNVAQEHAARSFTGTAPLVAPAGTLAAISKDDRAVNETGAPLNVTRVEPLRFRPGMRTLLPF